jgi:hypothetical protein
MFSNILYDFPGKLLDLLHLSDSTFHHLLGLLAVIVLLRLFIPLHFIMTKELTRRNEVADLAEEYHCTEFDIFIKAHTFYYGSDQPEKIKCDFITYLNNWSDNYVLPFYIRNFLSELRRDSSDSRKTLSNSEVNTVSKKIRFTDTDSISEHKRRPFLDWRGLLLCSYILWTS